MILTSYKTSFLLKKQTTDNWSSRTIDLTHIRRMTNQVGIIQHAKFAIPDYKHGYCLDDNVRALMLCGISNRIQPGSCDDLIDIYLAFIHYIQRDNGKFGNFMSFDNQFLDDFGTEDAFGRTIWALGSLIKNDARPYIQKIVKEIIDKAYPNVSQLQSLRAAAYSLCGLVNLYWARTSPTP